MYRVTTHGVTASAESASTAE